jgi:hypothetical protein
MATKRVSIGNNAIQGTDGTCGGGEPVDEGDQAMTGSECDAPAGFFREANGDLSAMRLMTALVILIMLLTWAYTVIATRTWIPLDVGDAVVILGSLFAKAYQKGKEEEGDAGRVA